jgi:superfamily II DNA or RNA helicase
MTAEETSIKPVKKLYPYQEEDITTLFQKLECKPGDYRLLYQLPTGGGKTVIFSEITKRFIDKYSRKVLVLTHRNELCTQTSTTLKKLGVHNKIINSAVSRMPKISTYNCYVGMVETLKNRLKAKKLVTDDIGLVIIDEAHHNSFRKLLGNFKNAFVIGVTATPLSSDRNLPMYKTYNELVTGQSIEALVEKGFLAKPRTLTYDVELNTLKIGIHGDFTVSTSDALYSSPAMLNLLLQAYEANSKDKKTLIFNNGIFTSKSVLNHFTDAGYRIRHLDNKTPASERKEIIQWFKKTKGAILTSVSILTTGFDEPSVQTVILNRATTSLTLFHQMVGRGSRKLNNKKLFTIIDLGNNTERFGEWSEDIDWKFVFENPEAYYNQLNYALASAGSHAIAPELRGHFPNSLEVAFDIQEEYKKALDNGDKPKNIIRQSVRQHAMMCIENSESISEALTLSEKLDKEIQWRVKEYGKCLGNATKNYRDWLLADYKQRLRTLIRKVISIQQNRKTELKASA